MGELVNKAFTELEGFEKGDIKVITKSSDFAKEFNVSVKTIERKLREGLGEELFEKRKKFLQSQSGRDFFNSLPKEKQQEIRDRSSYWARNGMLSEQLIKVQLEAEGWEVIRLFKKEKQENGSFKSFLRLEEIEDFLKGTARENKGVADFLFSLRLEGFDLPDFICKKRRYVKFFEVKNQKHLNNPEEISQFESIKRIWDKFRIETEISNLVIDLRDIEEFYEENNLNEILIEQNEKGEIFFHKQKNEQKHS